MENAKIKIYKTDEGDNLIDVKLENDTVWLNLNQFSELFDRDKSVISRHIGNVLKEGELDKI